MSMEVALEELSEVAQRYGPTAYAAVSAPDGPPRVTHVSPQIEGIMITIGLGRRSVELLGQQATMGLLWPATCLLYTSPSPRDATLSRMPSSA